MAETKKRPVTSYDKFILGIVFPSYLGFLEGSHEKREKLELDPKGLELIAGGLLALTDLVVDIALFSFVVTSLYNYSFDNAILIGSALSAKILAGAGGYSIGRKIGRAVINRKT